MSIFAWITSPFSAERKALSHYRRGMKRANKREHQAAIDEYTAAIRMLDSPEEVRAMALYNRALVHVALGEDKHANDDLETVLVMEEAGVNVKTLARLKLAKIRTRTQKAGV